MTLALALPDLKHPDPRFDDDDREAFDDNGLGLPGGVDKDKDCECKKDNIEEKEKKQREKEIQFQIRFEDALHNKVYVRRYVEFYVMSFYIIIWC